MSVFEKNWYRAFAVFLVLTYLGLIFWLTSRTDLGFPLLFPYQDTAFHFVEYHLFAFLLAHATARGSHKQRFWIAFGIASLVAIADEAHHSFLPGGSAAFRDWAADTIGAWAGAYLYLRSENVLRKGKNPLRK